MSLPTAAPLLTRSTPRTAHALATSFCRALRGPRAEPDAPEAPEAIESALLDFAARGRAAWPTVPLDSLALAAYLGELAPTDTPPLRWLGTLQAGDLFLACACAEGLPEALRAFDAAFLDKLELYLRSLRPSPELVAETRQALLQCLFIGVAGRPPKIRRYAGQGALGGWVRITAVRTALNLLDQEKAFADRKSDADAIARAFTTGEDPEIDLIRARCQEDFLAALREAIAGLSRRDRSLLRFTFVEHLTPARIGVMYGVHRTTAMRWIDAAQQEVMARTRALLMQRLRLSPLECDGMLALVMSRLEIMLASLFRTAS
jgi:RNA polymerase sigma-70 factor (ECF subfamily)